MERNSEIYSSDNSLDQLPTSRNYRNLPSCLGVDDVKNLRKDSSGRFIVPRGMEKVRVSIWDLRGGQKLTGGAAPTLEHLNIFLARNVNCRVYTGQTRATHPPVNGFAKRVKMWDRVLKVKRAGAQPLEANLEAYLKKNPNCEPYVGQDMVADEFGTTRKVVAPKGPTLLNLESGKLLPATQRSRKRNLSEYLEQNPHLIVYDSQNKRHQVFLRDARRARVMKRWSDRFGCVPRPMYPAEYESRQQAEPVIEDEREAAIQATGFVLDDNATTAMVAASENEYSPNVRKALEELEDLLGLNEHKEVLRSLAPEDLITDEEMDGWRSA